MATVAFIEMETGFAPAHVKEIRKGNIYYLVIDGARGSVHEALDNAQPDEKSECGWSIQGRLYE